ncbi:MAG: PulJ/GspJ family protein [Planctomycetota bacterium]
MKNNTSKTCYTNENRRGFTLAEVVASLVIGAMVLVTMLSIYARAEKSAEAIARNLDNFTLPTEILQRIAEDLDTVIASGSATKITIDNAIIKGYPAARLTIQKTFVDAKNKTQPFETIIWQSSYDYEYDSDSLVLFRSRSGMTLEDRVLDRNKENWERELFVPICDGITCFQIQVPRGEELLDKWPGKSLPTAIVATISFAEPYETVEGILEVPETEKIVRTIAIGRTRRITFELVKAEYADEDDEADEGEDDTGEEVEEGDEGNEDEADGGSEAPEDKDGRITGDGRDGRITDDTDGKTRFK